MAEATLKSQPGEAVARPARRLIVGIGASAGGLGAFRSFFSEMPADSGMAFVLVQHLDPDYNSALAEILGECTAMPVVKAVDGTVAAPNTVAVISQNAILKIEGGVLKVAPAETPTARRSSIDTFLASLVADQGENAVGIILSGFGSDGTVGIEAIKEGGGLTLSEAAFDHRAKIGMPQSATAGGFVDNVLQAQEMPARLLEYRDFHDDLEAQGLSESAGPGRPNHLMTICAVLNSRLGRDCLSPWNSLKPKFGCCARASKAPPADGRPLHGNRSPIPPPHRWASGPDLIAVPSRRFPPSIGLPAPRFHLARPANFFCRA